MRQLYQDNASTAFLLPEVCEMMTLFLDEFFSNPSSLHDWGNTTREAAEVALFEYLPISEPRKVRT